MSSPYRFVFDRLLTKVDPEQAHHAGFAAIRAASPALRGAARALPARAGVRVMGLDFPGVLGLAAGFDKNAVGIDALGALGFGFVEIGTVTGQPQAGNPKPRLLRLPADRAVVNRMGFNNDGADVVAERLAKRQRLLQRGRDAGARSPVLGINIGKTKVVAEEDAIADYEKSTAALAPYADYLVVNVSSPNTPGLRDLQAVEKLEPLLRAVRAKADQVTAQTHEARVPLLVKIAPDLSDDDVLAVADLSTSLGLDGIIATNTTIARSGLTSSADAIDRAGPGGLSGEPLRKRSLAVLRLLRGQVGADMTLIGVGGIAGVEDAVERLAAGANLLQAYTAFIYEGPLWPRRMNAAIAKEQRR